MNRSINRCKKIGKYVALSLAIFTGANYVSNQFVYNYNKNLNTIRNTAVFTSSGGNNLLDFLCTKTIDLFMYTPVTLRQNLKGFQVDWFSNAKKREVIDNVANSSSNYENAVFIGHGSRSCYEATDSVVYSDEIYSELEKGIRNKYRGELVQHTCGQKEFYDDGSIMPSMNRILLENPSKRFGFDGITEPLTNYLSSWWLLMTDSKKTPMPMNLYDQIIQTQKNIQK